MVNSNGESMGYAESDAESDASDSGRILDERIRRLAERAKEAIGGEAVRAVAERAGVAPNTIHNILNGGVPRLDNLLHVADATGVTGGWLATGEGPKHPGEAAPQDLSAFALVPFYEVAASAGAGAAIEDAGPSSQLAFRRDWLHEQGLSAAHLVAILARGDSMAPTVVDGSLLLVDTAQRELGRDGIAVLRWDDHLYAKRVQRHHDGSVRLRSDNPAYADELLDPAAAARLDVIGRVVWIARRCW